MSTFARELVGPRIDDQGNLHLAALPFDGGGGMRAPILSHGSTVGVEGTLSETKQPLLVAKFVGMDPQLRVLDASIQLAALQLCNV